MFQIKALLGSNPASAEPQPEKRKHGRPPKNAKNTNDLPTASSAKKRRGRPPKQASSNIPSSEPTVEEKLTNLFSLELFCKVQEKST